jgi:hypothetical protein
VFGYFMFEYCEFSDHPLYCNCTFESNMLSGQEIYNSLNSSHLFILFQRLLVPPEDISSSYSYRACARSLITPDGLICLLSPPTLMEILYITPPFSYTYQCGSTLLTSYLLVYMYSISLQIFSLLMRLILVFSTNFTQHPNWFMKLFPGIYWPSKWKSDNQSSRDVPRTKSPRLLRPAQIISGAMYHMILLLSFGLCSPVLAGYITFSLCANMCCWLVLIGRFLSYYRISPQRHRHHQVDTSFSFLFSFSLSFHQQLLKETKIMFWS